MSVFKNKAHMMKLIKQQLGIYSIKLPISDNDLMNDVIIDDTLLTYSIYFPLVKNIPCDLNQIRVKVDRDNTTSDVSNIYEIPQIFPKDEEGERTILGIENVIPFNDMRYQSVQSAFQTIESFQALAISQAIGNLESVQEPSFVVEFIPPNRFRINHGTYYKDRVILKVEYTYSKELYDIPMPQRDTFFDLAMLDVKRFLYNNLKYWDGFETAIARFSLKIEEWSSAESDRKEFLENLNQNFVNNRIACIWF